MDRKIKEDNVVPVAEACSSHCPSPSFVGLPDLLTFVFSWQGDQLCIRTKYRGTEHQHLLTTRPKTGYTNRYHLQP